MIGRFGGRPLYLMSANSGKYFDTGSSRFISPSYTNVRASTEVIGFVFEQIANTVSRAIGRPLSRSASPSTTHVSPSFSDQCTLTDPGLYSFAGSSAHDAGTIPRTATASAAHDIFTLADIPSAIIAIFFIVFYLS